jgi:hypothetical protein
MNDDQLPVLSDPLIAGHRVYLRSPDRRRVVRPPSPPLPMTADGQTAAGLGLYRHLDGEPHGGGVLAVTLDLGSRWEASEQADATVPADVESVTAPRHGPGRVRLWFGARPIATAPLPTGVRPIVAISAGLDQESASLLQGSAQNATSGPLFATAGGRLVVAPDPGSDGSGSVQIDGARIRAELAGSGVLSPTEVAAAIDGFIGSGLIRVSAPAPAPSLMFLAGALVTEELFEPVATAEPWSLIPGLHRPGYDPAGALRLRSRRRGSLTLSIDGSSLPWMAAAPLRLPGRPQLWDLPGSRVREVQVVVNGRWPEGVLAPAIEARSGDGPITSLPLTRDRQTLRLLPPPGGTGEHTWRVTGTHSDGTPLAGPWTGGDLSMLVIDPADLLVSSG